MWSTCSTSFTGHIRKVIFFISFVFTFSIVLSFFPPCVHRLSTLHMSCMFSDLWPPLSPKNAGKNPDEAWLFLAENYGSFKRNHIVFCTWACPRWLRLNWLYFHFSSKISHQWNFTKYSVWSFDSYSTSIPAHLLSLLCP